MNIELVKEEKSLVAQEKDELRVLDPEKAAAIVESYAPQMEAYTEAEPKVTAFLARVETEEYTPELCLDAKDLRIEIRKVRTGAEKVKKQQKDVYLKVGGAIQGVYNIIKTAVEKREYALQTVEDHFLNIEKARKQKLAEKRLVELELYEYDGPVPDLEEMETPFWETFLAGARTTYTDKKKSEKLAEDARKETDRKYNLMQTRKNKLFPLGQFIDLSQLSVETTEEEYQAIKTTAEEAKQVEAEGREEAQKAAAIQTEKLRVRGVRLQALPGTMCRGDEVFDIGEGQTFIASFTDLETFNNEEWEIVRSRQEKRFNLRNEQTAKLLEEAKKKDSLVNAGDKEQLEALVETIEKVCLSVNSPAAINVLNVTINNINITIRSLK